MVTEQSADQLLKELRRLGSCVGRMQAFHVLVALLVLAGGVGLIFAPGFVPFESTTGTPVVHGVLLLGGLVLLGAFAFFSIRVVQLANMMSTKRKSEKVIQDILVDDPELQSPFHRDIIMAIYENCLME